MGTQAAKKVGAQSTRGSVLSSVRNIITSTAFNRTVSIVAGVAATVAFVGAAASLGTGIVTVAAGIAIAGAIGGITHSIVKIATGKSTVQKEAINIGVNTASIITGGIGGALGMAGKVYSWGFSNTSLVMGIAIR